MAMKAQDVQNKSWDIKRQQAYETLYEGDRWDMVYGLFSSILDKLIENGTLTLDDLRDDDLIRLTEWKGIKERFPKE